LLLMSLSLAMIAGFGISVQAQKAPGVTVGGVQITGMPEDWTHHHIVFADPGTADEAIQKGTYDRWSRVVNDPRYVMQQLKRGLPARGPAAGDVAFRNSQANWLAASHRDHSGKGQSEKTDWAVSLGAGGVAQGMIPAKYTFDVNVAPSCTNDYAVFPINVAAGTGNTRAHVVGTFSTTTGFTGSGTVTLTVTPTVGTPTTLTLTASTTLNTLLNFQVFATASVANATTSATNLAAAVNRNLSASGLNELAAVSATDTVTIYTLTPGTRVVLTDSNTVNNLAFAAVVAGTNGSQANIVGFNQLYSGSGTPLCAGLTFPEFIFSYASGVGPVATSPTLSLDGTRVAYVENDANIGAILHVLHIAKGSTEYGTCSNTGALTPTCALHPVIPGSTAGSTASDYMLPLGLVATGIDSYSSPFVNYSDDTAYVGDNNGFLYAITPVFNGTPAKATAPYPVKVSTFNLSSPVVDVSGTGHIFFGDSDGHLYNYTAAGASAAAAIPVGGVLSATAHGVRDAPIVDSTNAVGYAVTGCNGTDSELMQFGFTTGATLTSKAASTLDAEGCTGAAQLYAPTVDNNYFSKGISSATAANNGEVDVCYAHSGHIAINQYQFTSGTMGTTAQYDNEFIAHGGAYECSPLAELYSKDVAYTPTALTQSGFTVTVTTATNAFVNGQVVTIAKVAAGTGGCTAGAVAGINAEQTITVTSGTVFTFTSPVSATITTGQCTLTSSSATGPTQDYMFFATNYTTPEAYTFTLPITGTAQAATATNTTSVTGGTSGMAVDNVSTSGQAASIYFGTLATSTTVCGTTAAYCAVKLTQALLQ
jgi:hypothetical protein